MSVLKPIVKKENLYECDDLYSVIDNQDKEISNLYIEDTHVSINLYGYDIEKCIIRNTVLTQSDFSKASITDVVFYNCDLSNCNFSEANLVRVEFVNCKLVGSKFINSLLYNVYMSECVNKYINLSESSIRDCRFVICNLSNSYIESVEFKNTSFSECNLIGAQLFKTKLNKIDFSDSIIEGIVISPDDLKGVIVSEMQALDLSRLLGLVIK